MSILEAFAAALDAAVLALTAWRIARSRERGLSLRLRIFLALSLAMLLGSLATGLYATAVDAETLGFAARFARVAPKAFVLASALLPVLASAAACVGARLARPVEELSDAAARIAEGEVVATMRSGRGAEAQKLARALTSMRREIADKPYAAAFLRDAWHDLKTPVAAITATLEVLEDGALDDPDAARRFLANLRRSADQLDHRLQDFVTLARFETSALAETQRTDLIELAGSAIDALEPTARARDVRVSISPARSSTPPHGAPVFARVDGAALSRALTNLVENAIKASPGGTVGVSVNASEGRGKTVAIDIVNEPASIPEGLRNRVFQRGATATTGAGAETASSGLGLAIARAAVEAHGGNVRFVELGPPRVVVRIELPA